MAPDTPARDEIAAKVIDIIAQHRKLPAGQVTLDSSFADLAIDSLDAMDLLFELEDAFDINIPDEVAQQMRGVRQAVDALCQVVAGRAAEAS
jgi:acyl carrier protein